MIPDDLPADYDAWKTTEPEDHAWDDEDDEAYEEDPADAYDDARDREWFRED